MTKYVFKFSQDNDKTVEVVGGRFDGLLTMQPILKCCLNCQVKMRCARNCSRTSKRRWLKPWP